MVPSLHFYSWKMTYWDFLFIEKSVRRCTPILSINISGKGDKWEERDSFVFCFLHIIYSKQIWLTYIFTQLIYKYSLIKLLQTIGLHLRAVSWVKCKTSDFPGDPVFKSPTANEEIWVWSLFGKGLTCQGATKPVGHNYWAGTKSHNC